MLCFIWSFLSLFLSFLMFVYACCCEVQYMFILLLHAWWLGSRVVSVLDSGTEGHCRVTVLGKLFTPIVPLGSPSSEIGSSRLKGLRG